MDASRARARNVSGSAHREHQYAPVRAVNRGEGSAPWGWLVGRSSGGRGPDGGCLTGPGDGGAGVEELLVTGSVALVEGLA